MPWAAAAQDATEPPATETDTAPAAEAAEAPAVEIDPGAPLTVGPWHLAAIDDAPEGYRVRGVASSELGTVALGNREFGGPAQPAAWVSQDAETWERATFAKGARKGLLEAAVATPDGWVAVGRDFPERALAWTSTDGKHWKAARKVDSAKGHVFYGVAATPIGLVAVGCEAQFHCKTGKAWVSKDGRSWKVLSKLPVQLPYAVSTVGDRIVVAGFSDGWDTNLSNAVTASSKNGRKWKLNDLRGPRGSGYSTLDARDDEVFAVGYRLGVSATDDSAVLSHSANGRDWAPIEAAELQGWSGGSVAAMDELVLVAGQGNFDDVIAPVTFSSTDLESWTPGTFSEGLRDREYSIFATTFTHDGDRAAMVGAANNAPAIWWADVAPAGSPEVEPAPVTAIGPVTPERFAAAVMPDSAPDAGVRDVISGGPGYIAVGGGAAEGEPARALAWTSADGMAWEAAKLPEDAGSGLIEAVAPLPDAGYVAVGNDSASAEARVWTSADGVTWELAPPHESLAGSVLRDVTATPDGVAAAGCEAYPDCRTGRVWTSTDGLTWELDTELALMPFAVGALGSLVAVGGTDDVSGPDGGEALIAAGEGDSWGMAEPLGKADSRIVSMASSPDGLVAAGWQQRPGTDVESALFLSPNGLTWDPFTHKRLRGVTASSVELNDDGVLLIGTKVDKDQGPIPLAFWTRDLEELETIRFPKETGDAFVIEGGGMASDGSMAFAVGADGQGPAIWYSPIE